MLEFPMFPQGLFDFHSERRYDDSDKTFYDCYCSFVKELWDEVESGMTLCNYNSHSHSYSHSNNNNNNHSFENINHNNDKHKYFNVNNKNSGGHSNTEHPNVPSMMHLARGLTYGSNSNGGHMRQQQGHQSQSRAYQQHQHQHQQQQQQHQHQQVGSFCGGMNPMYRQHSAPALQQVLSSQVQQHSNQLRNVGSKSNVHCNINVGTRVTKPSLALTPSTLNSTATVPTNHVVTIASNHKNINNKITTIANHVTPSAITAAAPRHPATNILSSAKISTTTNYNPNLQQQQQGQAQRKCRSMSRENSGSNTGVPRIMPPVGPLYGNIRRK